MPNEPSAERSAGELGAALSNAVVHVFAQYVGRGPTRARTTIDGKLVVVCLHDTMTTAEHTLVRAGREAEVQRLRRAFQETLKPELIAAVEGLTHGKVVAFMSDNNTEPDVAAEVFLLEAPPRAGS